MSSFASAQSVWVRKTSNTVESLLGVGHGGGIYAAVGSNGAIVSSPDANTWSKRNSGTTADLRAIIHAGGQFVAAGSNGTVLTSPDGTAWTTRTTGVSAFLSGLAFGGGSYVAVGTSGTIITSTDAINWTAANSGTGLTLQSVHHADGLFIATGESGKVLTSPDGSAWSSPLSPTTLRLHGSGYFNGRHFAIGQSGVIVSSPDGANWSLESSGTLTRLRAIANDGTTAVISGDSGALFTSSDGTVWSPATSGQNVTLRGVTYANDRFVTVGEPAGSDGMVLVGDRDPGIRFQASAVSVNELAGSVSLTVERLGPTSAAASIAFQTTEGTAIGNIDFTTSAGTANFAIGESATDLVIPISNNSEAEPPESFTVTLSSPSPAGLLLFDPITTTVNIVDAQDSDFDGLPDDWEILHFGDVASFGPPDDPDNDGNNNARELADGTDPDDPASANYTLNVSVAAGLGTVTVTPSLAAYPTGTTVTLTPQPSGEFTLASWQGDATGTADPLVFNITSDLVIEALFEVSLTDALDDPCLAWTPGGNGPPWAGQGLVTADGADAAATGGHSIGQQSSIETTVHGPVELTFDWKVSTSQFDQLRFYVDGSQRASLNGEVAWETRTFFIAGGTHTIRWIYSKNSTSAIGSNQAWLDQVTLTYRYQDWQRGYFNASERADPAISGPGADSELDAIANLLEYLFDLHPKIGDAGSPNLPRISVVESGGQKFSALTWSQHHKRAANLDITVEFSTSLEPGSWQALGAPVEGLSTSDGMETVRVTNPTPLSASPRGFFRLKVSLNP